MLMHTLALSTEDGLSYSIDMWTRQLRDFIDETIGQPVFLAGNSLGGLLSAHLAATQPHLCRYHCIHSTAIDPACKATLTALT